MPSLVVWLKATPTLTSRAQLVERHPAKQKVASSVPGQGTFLGCGFGPWLGRMQEATNRCFSHISMFLSLPNSKNEIFKKATPQNHYSEIVSYGFWSMCIPMCIT